MSEKLTFQELIESIAEETDNSKKFTRDFIKDFVDVISDGLKNGDNINIAGFGKFKLRQVNERQGYNPQTEEKITIPAHHKMVFKPYKNLREAVNTPYAHLQPELIDNEEKEETEVKAEPDYQEEVKNDEAELKAERNPVIDELESLFEEEEDSAKDTEKSTAQTSEVGPNQANELDSDEKEEEKNITEERTMQEDDIVEYQNRPAITMGEDEVEDDLAEFMGTAEDKSEKTEKQLIDEVNYSFTSPLGNALEEDKPVRKELAISPVTSTKRKSRKKSSSGIAAAALLLVLLAATGVWYFSSSGALNLQQTEPNRILSAANVPSKSDVNISSQQPKVAAPVQTDGLIQNRSKSAKKLVITKGATLWSIADEQLGNPRLWPWIYDTNEAIENPDLIFAGSALSVPLPSGIPSGLSAKDSIAVAKGYIATYHWYKNSQSPRAKIYLWAARKYHKKIRSLADVQIDKTDLNFVKSAR